MKAADILTAVQDVMKELVPEHEVTTSVTYEPAGPEKSHWYVVNKITFPDTGKMLYHSVFVKDDSTDIVMLAQQSARMLRVELDKMMDQKKLRMRVSILAYAYEELSTSLVSDSEYDLLASQVDTNVPTDRPDLDEWFKDNYDEFTGAWVHNHPEVERIAAITVGIVNRDK